MPNFITPPISAIPSPATGSTTGVTEMKDQGERDSQREMKGQRPVKRKWRKDEEKKECLGHQSGDTLSRSPPDILYPVQELFLTPQMEIQRLYEAYSMPQPTVPEYRKQFADALLKSHPEAFNAYLASLKLPSVTPHVYVQGPEAHKALLDHITESDHTAATLSPNTHYGWQLKGADYPSGSVPTADVGPPRPPPLIISPFRQISDPAPPLQKFSSSRYFKNGYYVPQDAEAQSKRQSLTQLNKPASIPQGISRNNSHAQLLVHPRYRTKEQREAADFRSLETSYVLRVDTWLRGILRDLTLKLNSSLSYGNFKLQLTNTPTRLAEQWKLATENNDFARQQAIIRLHEIIYSLFSNVRHEYDDDREGVSGSAGEGAVDPTLRLRVPLASWKDMDMFWTLLNGKQGESVKMFWIPVVQMHHGLPQEFMGCSTLFK